MQFELMLIYAKLPFHQIHSIIVCISRKQGSCIDHRITFQSGIVHIITQSLFRSLLIRSGAVATEGRGRWADGGTLERAFLPGY